MRLRRSVVYNVSWEGLLALTGFVQYLSNEVAFCTLSMIHPITYALSNTLKRSIVVGASLVFFGQSLPPAGAAGAALALLGALGYSLAIDRDNRKAATLQAAARCALTAPSLSPTGAKGRQERQTAGWLRLARGPAERRSLRRGAAASAKARQGGTLVALGMPRHGAQQTGRAVAG